LKNKFTALLTIMLRGELDIVMRSLMNWTHSKW